MDKKELRTKLLGVRNSIPLISKNKASNLIHQKILSLSQWQKSSYVGCYISLPQEVDTRALIKIAWKQKKALAAPVIDHPGHRIIFHRLHNFDSLIPGSMGILEPIHQPVVPSEILNLLIIPGVGFDEHCNRLGYGGGFYDSYLAHTSAYKIGVSFDSQIVPSLPITKNDVSLDCVISEKRIIVKYS